MKTSKTRIFVLHKKVLNYVVYFEFLFFQLSATPKFSGSANLNPGRQSTKVLNPFTPRVSYGDIKVILTFESVDEILKCDHSNAGNPFSSSFTWYYLYLD